MPGGSVTAEAIRYVQSRWDGLTRFLDDGCIELDTNPVERAMRPIALNRKNALFAGSDEGAEHWAILATLIECCKLHGANPAIYLEDVLTRLVGGHLNSRLDELTPLGLEGRSARGLTVKTPQRGWKSTAYPRSFRERSESCRVRPRYGLLQQPARLWIGAVGARRMFSDRVCSREVATKIR